MYGSVKESLKHWSVIQISCYQVFLEQSTYMGQSTYNNCKHYITGKSAIADHTATQKHAIDFDSGLCRLSRENNSAKRKLAEALYIKSEQVFETNSPSTFLFIFKIIFYSKCKLATFIFILSCTWWGPID